MKKSVAFAVSLFFPFIGLGRCDNYLISLSFNVHPKMEIVTTILKSDMRIRNNIWKELLVHRRKALRQQW